MLFYQNADDILRMLVKSIIFVFVARKVIIRISDGEIFFNDHFKLRDEQTNLALSQLKLPKNYTVYWLIQQKSYDRATQELFVQVDDYFYRLEDSNMFLEQQPKTAIERVHFTNLRKPQLIQEAIAYYQKYVYPVHQWSETVEENEITDEILNPLKEENVLEQPLSTTVVSFWMPFKDAHFKLGYVTCRKYIDELRQVVDFQIENENLLAEYEYIKSYFPKILKKKKFLVEATIQHKGEQEIIEVDARSPELDSIDEDLIESVKTLRTESLIKRPKIADPDKSLFTSDDIFSTLDTDDPEGNIFKQSEEDILHFLIGVRKVRNRKQLEYLAGKKQSESAKLKFTLHPHFGFLFLIEGKTMYHFCWELLNSHATYIWSCDKRKKLLLQYKRIERTINAIRDMGRQQYKASYRDCHIDEDLTFSVIQHDAVNSNLIDGFVQWKHRLNERIV